MPYDSNGGYIGSIDPRLLREIAERFNARAQSGSHNVTIIGEEADIERHDRYWREMVADLQSLLASYGCVPRVVAQAEDIARQADR